MLIFENQGNWRVTKDFIEKFYMKLQENMSPSESLSIAMKRTIKFG